LKAAFILYKSTDVSMSLGFVPGDKLQAGNYRSD
jgi:hypothetical protein